jgi:hypothetical protein
MEWAGKLSRIPPRLEPRRDIGQNRAVKALRRGLAMKVDTTSSWPETPARDAQYNPKASEQFNVGGSIPNDLCYVNNFKNRINPGSCPWPQVKDYSKTANGGSHGIPEKEDPGHIRK